MNKLVWHDEDLFSFEYSSSTFVIEKSTEANDWHFKYCWKLYTYFRREGFCNTRMIDRVCIRHCATLARAKRIAEAIAKG